MSLGTNKMLCYSFKPGKSQSASKRYNHFVLFPTPLSLTNMNCGDLDFDLSALLEMSNNTLRMLANNKLRVCPHPIDLAIDPDDANCKHNIFSMSPYAKLLKSERQLIPTFHFVGHGTADGIGSVDFEKHISPELLAYNFYNFIKMQHLESLFDKPISFHFHTCNGAYVDINEHMLPNDILAKIYKESFIGRFYQAMKSFGFQQMSVIGYRGYYTTMTSRSSQEARIQDSFSFPTNDISAQKSQYIIENDACKTSPQTQLYYNVSYLPPASKPISLCPVKEVTTLISNVKLF